MSIDVAYARRVYGLNVTRFKELCFIKLEEGCWQFCDVVDGMVSQIGKHYPTREQLIQDIEVFASERGYPGASEYKPLVTHPVKTATPYYDFKVPELPSVPDGYAFCGFVTCRTGHKDMEKKSDDMKTAEIHVEAMILDSCVLYAACHNDETGEEMNAVWKIGAEEWEPWKAL